MGENTKRAGLKEEYKLEVLIIEREVMHDMSTQLPPLLHWQSVEVVVRVCVERFL